MAIDRQNASYRKRETKKNLKVCESLRVCLIQLNLSLMDKASWFYIQIIWRNFPKRRLDSLWRLFLLLFMLERMMLKTCYWERLVYATLARFNWKVRQSHSLLDTKSIWAMKRYDDFKSCEYRWYCYRGIQGRVFKNLWRGELSSLAQSIWAN